MDGSGRGAQIAPTIADAIQSLKNKQTVAAKETAVTANLQDGVDYLASLFDGENLTEDFKLKAETIFEAAINEKVSLIEQNILAAAKEVIEEQVASQQDMFVEQVDGYLNYVITEWMEENKVAIEKGLRTEIAENFIHGLKSLFETSFIDVPQEKYNVIDDLYDANSELQENVNNLIKENIQLKNEITARLCAEAFIEESAGLADTQVEKLAKLAEGIEFSGVDQYKQKVALLKESYFGSNREESAPIADKKSYAQQASRMVSLTEDTGSYVGTDVDNAGMENIVNTLSVLNRNKARTQKLDEVTASDRVRSLLNSGTVQDNFI
jgi:hypothetical protein